VDQLDIWSWLYGPPRKYVAHQCCNIYEMNEQEATSPLSDVPVEEWINGFCRRKWIKWRMDKWFLQKEMSYRQSFPAVCTFVRNMFTRYPNTFKHRWINCYINNVNVNYLKITKKHRGPHKTLSVSHMWAACLRPWFNTTKQEKTRSHIIFQQVG